MLKLAKSDIKFLCDAAHKAAAIIMSHYRDEIHIDRKEDNSPVTAADLESNECIVLALKKKYPAVPIVSEENTEEVNVDIIKHAKEFWLIDPLDGTWSFIERQGYFVINIALIRDGMPVWGLIYSPLTKECFYMNEFGQSAYKKNGGRAKILDAEKDRSDGMDFLVSERNLDQLTGDFVNLYTIKTITPVSSAMKFGFLLLGVGDIYPRFKRTGIWDTASGHALLKAIGGDIYDLHGRSLIYNKNLYNPDFVAVAKVELYNKS